MDESGEAKVKKAFEYAKSYEMKCTGCAQTAMAGIFDALGIWNDDVFRCASGLADGIGLTGDGSCGALVGASLIIGHLFGREKRDFQDILKPMKSYLLVKELHDRFVEKYGSCRCYDIQEKLMGRTYDLYDTNDLKDAFKSGMIDVCSTLVGNCASLAVEVILAGMEKQD